MVLPTKSDIAVSSCIREGITSTDILEMRGLLFKQKIDYANHAFHYNFNTCHWELYNKSGWILLATCVDGVWKEV